VASAVGKKKVILADRSACARKTSGVRRFQNPPLDTHPGKGTPNDRTVTELTHYQRLNERQEK